MATSKDTAELLEELIHFSIDLHRASRSDGQTLLRWFQRQVSENGYYPAFVSIERERSSFDEWYTIYAGFDDEMHYVHAEYGEQALEVVKHIIGICGYMEIALLEPFSLSNRLYARGDNVEHIRDVVGRLPAFEKLHEFTYLLKRE